MTSLYYCKMDLPIIDGKSEHRRKLAVFQSETYGAASEILKGLSQQIAEMGYEIVPVTIDDNGIQKGAIALAPMSLEQYVAFSKALHSAKEEEEKPTQEEGSSLSE